MKIELTKEHRNRIYKEALERIKNCDSIYICSAIYYTFRPKYSPINENIKKMVSSFPELQKRKPIGLCESDRWFPMSDKQSRINLLTECIKETE